MDDLYSTLPEVLELMVLIEVLMLILIYLRMSCQKEQMGVVSALMNIRVNEDSDDNSAKNIQPSQRHITIKNITVIL